MCQGTYSAQGAAQMSGVCMCVGWRHAFYTKRQPDHSLWDAAATNFVAQGPYCDETCQVDVIESAEKLESPAALAKTPTGSNMKLFKGQFNPLNPDEKYFQFAVNASKEYGPGLQVGPTCACYTCC